MIFGVCGGMSVRLTPRVSIARFSGGHRGFGGVHDRPLFPSPPSNGSLTFINSSSPLKKRLLHAGTITVY